MGKKNLEGDGNKKETEGKFLLGKPKFKKLENGRYRCVQTGHELPGDARESYAQTKHCRLGLIDSALARNKPPLNMFNQDPLCRSKLICKLTGDTVNKTEEHIWKHINGKRFLNKLEKEEAEAKAGRQETDTLMEEGTEQKQEMATSGKENGLKKKKKNDALMEEGTEQKQEMTSSSKENGLKKDKKKKKKNDALMEDGTEQKQEMASSSKENGLKKDKKKEKKKKKQKEVEDVSKIISEVRDTEDKGSETEEEEFWMPPVGERWDFDDGGDRWGSGSDSDSDSDQEIDEIDETGAAGEANNDDARELSKRMKRTAIEIGPSDSASKKKKKKKIQST